MDPHQILQTVISSYDSGRFHEALAAMDALTSLGIGAPGLHHLRACSLMQIQQFAKVLEELQKDCEGDQPTPEALAMRDELKRAIEPNPAFSEPITHFGRYVVSGISPDGSGTGRFFKTFKPIAEKHGRRCLHPLRTTLNLGEMLHISSIKNSEVLILHPQTLGIATVRALHENQNRLSMYVLDSGFFCIRSYNHRPGLNGECLDCLGNVDNCHASCEPFPVKIGKAENLDFLRWLKEVSGVMKFYCQTQGQERLLKEHFGAEISTTVVGMMTDELDAGELVLNYDVIFHGSASGAKGYPYVIELARLLPEYRFLIPSLREHVDQDFRGIEPPPNVTFQDLKWESGLRHMIENCRLVICPSSWSAPVEGALLKSLHFNGNVAVLHTQYGFAEEIPDGAVLKLDMNIGESAERLRSFLQSGASMKEATAEWIRKYRAGVNLDRVFE